MYAGIETGGTKTVCAVGDSRRIEARTQFPTGTDPAALVARCAAFFAGFDVKVVGLGTFGPCDLDPASPTFGHILSTPKPGWQGTDLRGALEQALGAPVLMTSDVSAAAFAEARLVPGSQQQDLVYITIGTGIGVGVVRDGRISHGRRHAEMGHLLLPQSTSEGACPYHGGCFEGLASGPALSARLRISPEELADEDPAWVEQAAVVAAGLHNIVCTEVPDLVVVGGGVGSREALHTRLSPLLRASLAGYLPVPEIVRPRLGSDAGVRGALLLAETGAAAG